MGKGAAGSFAWWPTRAPVADWRAMAASHDCSLILAAADREAGGGLHVSQDGGHTWLPCWSSYPRSWRAVAVSRRGEMMAACDSMGMIYATHAAYDSSSTPGDAWHWKAQPSAGERDWRGVAIGEEGNFLVAVAAGGRLWTKYCQDNDMSTSSVSVAGDSSSSANDCVVSFNSKGGAAVEPLRVNAGYSIALGEWPRPTRAARSFGGWCSDFQCLTLFDESAVVNYDLTLFAKWNKATGAAFHANGGGDIPDQSATLVNGQYYVTAPPAPVRAGHTFQGWYADELLQGALFDFAAPISGFRDLYAKWQIDTYAVTFNSNGGTAVGPQSVVFNNQVAKPADPVFAGYRLIGWFLGSAESSYDFNSGVQGAMVLKAKWTIYIPSAASENLFDDGAQNLMMSAGDDHEIEMNEAIALSQGGCEPF
jgi:uncharacterized repeat protein (TIGR02543 family)